MFEHLQRAVSASVLGGANLFLWVQPDTGWCRSGSVHPALDRQGKG